MKTIDKYLHCDVYQVENVDGKKVVHVDGYVYHDDDSYQLVQFTFCYVEISELIGLSQEKATEKVEAEEELAMQYQHGITLEEADSYYEGCTQLPFSQLAEDTPEGMYVNA